MTQELQTIDTSLPTGMALRDPEKILDEAKVRCTALTKMIEETESFMQIGKKRHLYIEAWITLAQFYGCTARIVRTEDIEIGGVMGFKAHAEVVHDQTGTRLSSAESVCMRDEDNWDTRPKYEWRDGENGKRERVKVGEEKVPLHQVMSMAQTRAMSKALAAKFRWVVVMGGWSATPAEEMTGNEHPHEAREKKQYELKESPKSDAPRLSFREYKGCHIDDPKVPIDELYWWQDYTEKAVNDPVKAKYKKSNSALHAALVAEIAKREKSGEPEGKEPSTRQPMDDDAWIDYCQLWHSQNEAVYLQVAKEFEIKDPGRLPANERNNFQDRIKELSRK